MTGRKSVNKSEKLPQVFLPYQDRKLWNQASLPRRRDRHNAEPSMISELHAHPCLQIQIERKLKQELYDMKKKKKRVSYLKPLEKNENVQVRGNGKVQLPSIARRDLEKLLDLRLKPLPLCRINDFITNNSLSLCTSSFFTPKPPFIYTLILYYTIHPFISTTLSYQI